MENYNPVAKAYELLTKAFNSPDPSYGDLLIVIEEAIGYLGEALDPNHDDQIHYPELLNIVKRFYDENWKAANEYFTKAGNPDDHHTVKEQVNSVCIRSEGIGRAGANMLLLDILRREGVDIFGGTP